MNAAHLGIAEVEFESKRFELGRLDEPALLGDVDERANLLGFKKFVHGLLSFSKLVVTEV